MGNAAGVRLPDHARQRARLREVEMPGKGDGIAKRKDGRYMARYTVQTPDAPKRKRIYGRKYKEVEKKLNEARGDVARGIVLDAQGQTVGQWLEDVVTPSKTHRTYATHRQ